MKIGPNHNGVYVKHGYARTRIDNIYGHMIRRCYSPKSNSYKDYGAKGITVCDEWRNDKKKFFEWSMENGYAENLTLDRIDCTKGYSPENCRWVGWLQQQNNRSNNRHIEIDGEIRTVSEWSRISGVKPDTIYIRLKKGWDAKTAVFKPPMTRSESAKMAKKKGA